MKHIAKLFLIIGGLLICGPAHAYPHYSPYAYAFCNPVRCIDPDGRRPIYSTIGYLLGTDDDGLQGEAIIMDSRYFHQGMSPDKALKYHLGMAGLVDPDAVSRFNDSYSGLSSRPDWDGYLTLAEANEWYRNGEGKPLYVSLAKIDLSGLESLGDDYVGQEKYINLFFASGSLNDAMVYGTIKLIRYPQDSVRAKADFYDFDIKPWKSFSSILRNIQTIIGSQVAGQGTGYYINLYGSHKLKLAPRLWEREVLKRSQQGRLLL